MSTVTYTTTRSAVRNIQQVTVSMGQELLALQKAHAHVACRFDLDQALIDLSIMFLNDVVESVHLQFYIGRELVREHAYVICDDPIEAYGLPPERPPIGYIPEKCRLRLVVVPNRRQPQEYTDSWFARLGWDDAPSLERPHQAQYQTYGAFSSGAYAVERRLLVNPKYDQPIATASSQYGFNTLKEGKR